MSLFKNFVEIIGNLGDNPKYIMSQQQQPRFTFDICTSKPYKQGEEWKTKSTWIKCTAWGNAATMFSKMQFAKGDRVQVEGELQNNDWINNQNGEQHHEIYLKVSEMRKMAKPAKSGNSNKSAPSAPSAPASAQGTAQQADYQAEFYAQQQAEVDDLPF